MSLPKSALAYARYKVIWCININNHFSYPSCQVLILYGVMSDSFKLVIKSQTALGGVQCILIPFLLFPIFGILQEYHRNDRRNFNCDPKPSDFIRQCCSNSYTSNVTKPHGLQPRNVIALTLGGLYLIWIVFAIFGAMILRKRPGKRTNRNTKIFLCAYFFHVFLRILFLGVMLGLVCSYRTIFLPSVFTCDVNQILQTNCQTALRPLNQTKITLQCNDLHHKEKSEITIAFIILDAIIMVVSVLEVLHLYCIRENYLQHLLGELEEFEFEDLQPSE